MANNFQSLSKGKKKLVVFGGAILIALIFFAFTASPLANLMTDKYLFGEVGHSRTWSKLFFYKLVPTMIIGLIFFFFILINLLILNKFLPKVAARAYKVSENAQITIPSLTKGSKRMIIFTLTLFGTVIAMPNVFSKWNEWLMFFNSTSFGRKEKIFHNDISFYVFKWPLLMSLAQWFFVLFIVCALLIGIYAFLLGAIDISSKPIYFARSVQVHLIVIFALISLSRAVITYLERFSILFSKQATFDGASYTQVHAVLPAKNLMTILWLIVFAVLLYFAFKTYFVLPAITFAAVLLVSVLLQTTYPYLVQKFSVAPNLISKEKIYAKENISATKYAYKIDSVEIDDKKYSTELEAKDSQSALDALNNTVLWDEQSLSWYLSQRKEGAFYNFSTPTNVIKLNTDSKKIEHDLVAARELVSSQDLPDTSWVSKHLVYTSGQGVQIASATQVGERNQPVYRDTSKLENGRIFFGTSFKDYVVVNTKQKQQGNPKGVNIKVGDNLSSVFKKAMYSIKYGDYSLFVSSQLTDKSNIIQSRDPIERVNKIAPFLSIDSKPYLSTVNNKLVWVIDAYTTSQYYPYSQSVNDSINYIRHSVKATVDTYSGKVNLYIWDKKDPMIKVYEKSFPDLFNKKIPQELKTFQRYPHDMFEVQSSLLAKYYLDDPEKFLKGSDFFRVSPKVDLTQSTDGSTTAQSTNDKEPIKYVMQNYSGKGSAFVAFRTYVPLNTSFRMASFITGSPDEKISINVIKNSRNSSLLSIEQTEGQTQSSDVISQQFTLLSQRGSEILPGDMQIIPAGDSMLYARPYFVRGSAKDSIPQLTFVVISQKGLSVCGQNYEEAVANLIEKKSGCNVFKSSLDSNQGTQNTTASTGSSSNITSSNSSQQDLIDQLNKAANDYQKALEEKDLGKLQAAADKMREIALLLAKK